MTKQRIDGKESGRDRPVQISKEMIEAGRSALNSVVPSFLMDQVAYDDEVVIRLILEASLQSAKYGNL